LNSRLDDTPHDGGYSLPRPRRLVSVVVRATIGVALIAFLTWRANLGSVFSALRGVTFGYVTVAYVLVVAALILGAFRWRPYLHAIGFEISASTAIRLSLIGSFFNAFLPTGVGGDAYKALRLPRDQGTVTSALASVLLDRAAGVVGMALIAVIGVASQMAQGNQGAVLASALGVAILVCLIYVVLQIVGRHPDAASATVRPGLSGRFVLLLRTVASGAGDRRASAHGITMGVVTGIALLGASGFLARALHLSVPIGFMSAVLLLASVIAVVPLSINGVGFRESAYVWGLTSSGVSHEEALAFALLALGVGLASSAVGGLLFAFAGGSSSAQTSKEGE
jgi:glycosyltransferase 2 family protein